MTEYENLLNQPEWKNKRLGILTRDNGACRRCGKKGNPLEVHHTYYKANTKPWEYEDDALLSVCRDCHQHIHQNEIIPFLDSNGNDAERCQRCGGSGFIPPFKHVENGVCFKCHGAGFNIRDFSWQIEKYARYIKTENPQKTKNRKEAQLPNFEIGTIHLNKKGLYIVRSISLGKATIEYANGEIATFRIGILKSIEQTILETYGHWLSENEALKYLEKEEKNLEPKDRLQSYNEAFKRHKIAYYIEST